MADLTQSGAPHPARHPSDPDTTGHEWDGIQEFNNPLPRWWLWTLYGTIVWALVYMVLYPAMPLLNDYTRGFWEYSQRGNVLADVEKARNQRLAQAKGLAEASLAQIKADPDMLRMAMASGKAAFGDNCAACHGTGATGRTGYPNLQDDEWLWGGTLEDIHQTLRVGIRSTHLETRMGDMPSFGTSGVLKDNEIEAVAQYVLSLSRQPWPRRRISSLAATCSSSNAPPAMAMTARANPSWAPRTLPMPSGSMATRRKRSRRPSSTAARA